MKTKFPRSNIEVNGEIWITDYKIGVSKKIELSTLNQSKSGVYCLRNKLNDRLYIGMTSNLERRKWRHFNDLRMGKHPSKLLQEDYDFCDSMEEVINMFEFEVIIYCYPSQLTFWENLLITNLNPYYNGKKKKELEFKTFSDEYVKEMQEEEFEESENDFQDLLEN